MASQMQRQMPIIWSVILCGLALLITSCSDGGDNGREPEVPPPSPRSAEKAVMNLLDIYRTALQQEDIDRLQLLLPIEVNPTPESPSQQQDIQQHSSHDPSMDAQSFLRKISDDFRNLNILDAEIRISDAQIDATPSFASATFQERITVEDSVALEQRTLVINTTLNLIGNKTDGVISFQIADVFRDEPQLEIITPGQIVAGMLTRVIVNDRSDHFAAEDIQLEVRETGETQTLLEVDGKFYGFFTAPDEPNPQPLQLHFNRLNDREFTIPHRYRLRIPDEGVVERIQDTQIVDFSSITTAPNGSIWAGGNASVSRPIVTFFRVQPGSSRARFGTNFLPDSSARMTDIIFDHMDRLHVVLSATPEPRGDEEEEDEEEEVGVQPGAGALFDINLSDTRLIKFCQTINVFDESYEFLTPEGQRSPSTRALAAEEGGIWLFGSDGGVARVNSDFTIDQGTMECGDLQVTYEDIVKRQNSELPTNTVPALVETSDGAVWFGTPLGLTRRQDNQFMHLPFERPFAFPEPAQVITLENYIQDVAQAIFDARPVAAVNIRGLSLLEAFGRALTKEDFIFSAVEDDEGRLWAGTLGGGLRLIEFMDGQFQDTLHVTRQDALVSNIIFALAERPRGVIWVATDEGVSQLHTAEVPLKITNFSALDGLQTPVRDLAVDDNGTPWMATGRGLYRIVQQAGLVQGQVRTVSGRPIVGADVIAFNTPFRTVTDTEGYFTLANLPRGSYRLHIDGQFAVEGPFASTGRAVHVTGQEQTIEEVTLARVTMAEAPAQLEIVSGKDVYLLANAEVSLQARVIDANAQPMHDITVTFQVIRGSGVLTEIMVPTNTQGEAKTHIQVSSLLEPSCVVVSAEGITPVTAAFTVVQAEALSLVEVSGNNQEGEQGQELAEPLVVRVEAQFQSPIASPCGDLSGPPAAQVQSQVFHNHRPQGALEQAMPVPVVGVEVMGEIIQGNADFVNEADQPIPRDMAEVVTNDQGEALFSLRTGEITEENIVTQVTVADTSAPSPPRELIQFTSVGDAGDLPAAAQVVDEFGSPDGLFEIRGSIDSSDDVDMYRLTISKPSEFSATTTFRTDVQIEDSQLFLFDAAGRGICANEDNPASPPTDSSRFFAALPQGACPIPESDDYFLAISTSVRDPVDASGNEIFPDPVGADTQTILEPIDPNAVVSGWAGLSERGNYVLKLSGVNINFPPPECLAPQITQGADGRRIVSLQVQDRVSGLAAIEVIESVGDLEVMIPDFAIGTTEVTVTAVDLNPFRSDEVSIRVTNTAGVSEVCFFRLEQQLEPEPPSCVQTLILQDGLPIGEISARDPQSGLSRIEFSLVQNATLTVNGDAFDFSDGRNFIIFDPPTTDTVRIRAEKIDLNELATVVVEAFNNDIPEPNLISCDIEF